MGITKSVALLALGTPILASNSPGLPFVINTWSGPFEAATETAYRLLSTNCTPSALDAVQAGCTTCQETQCDSSVGYGGSPDENCETTLDAMIIDGETLNAGAVAGLRRIKDAIGVARMVLDTTTHTMLSGDLATQFAVEMGFEEEDLTTPASKEICETWKEANCQPNYRVNVLPQGQCGPYTPDLSSRKLVDKRPVSHDTISMVAIAKDGAMAAATSTNGLTHKVPGRVGDGPIVGSGSYADNEVGGCGATGDGDIMMRFLPCYQALESMRRGMSPAEAAEDAVRRMVSKYPKVSSGLVVVDNKGNHAGAASGWTGTFTYSFRGGDMGETKVVEVPNIA
ncbi:aspartylglucosaminidase [Emericellopsis atlantica]|uniref:Aspartylglucosaminidase n=1 Tax=Emericellopsis atlantica TaxID=2614577 RepID=A0A9P8CRV5_9HYPO|nr:aspartylglucosaminidase [Emericellopsis atlantica]KAG9256737.1 aspartylglucosaminidase [Emericellopsis atlantica]